jgi:hypothetical protein
VTIYQIWHYVYGDVPRGAPDPLFKDKAEEFELWRRNRELLMSRVPAGAAPLGLFTYESEAFATVGAVRALGLGLPALHDGRCEFMTTARWHRQHARLELAERFERLEANVRTVIREMEATT